MGSQKLPFFITNSSGLNHPFTFVIDHFLSINKVLCPTQLHFRQSKEQIILLNNWDKDIWPILASSI